MTRSPAKSDMLRARARSRSWPTRSIPTRSPVPRPHRHSGVKNGVTYNLQGETS